MSASSWHARRRSPGASISRMATPTRTPANVSPGRRPAMSDSPRAAGRRWTSATRLPPPPRGRAGVGVRLRWPAVARRQMPVEEVLALLEATPERLATVTGAGRPLERTVVGYAGWLAVHERPHVKQVARIAAAMG